MKTLMATLVLFMAVTAQASSGQQYREDIRNLLKVHKSLQEQTTINGSICASEQYESHTILTTEEGKVYSAHMGSFSNPYESESSKQTAELIDLSNCSVKKFKF